MATRETYPRQESASPRVLGRLSRVLGGGVMGNHRLTAATGLVLLVLLAMEGFTVLSVKAMFTAHAFVGLLLIPPIGLKLASTGYRFVRYYTGSARYRAAGPPDLVLRVLAPPLIFLTAGLFGTGAALLLLGPAGEHPWRQVHTVFFFFWFLVMAVHVLAYMWRTPSLVRADIADLGGSRNALPGALTRQSLVLGSLVLGLAVAIAAIPWDSAWVQLISTIHHGG